jgi:hypothetical protein
MLQPELRPSSQAGEPESVAAEPENARACCSGRPRRRSHASTTGHARLPLRLVTLLDGHGQPQLRLMVVQDPPVAAPPIALQKRAI